MHIRSWKYVLPACLLALSLLAAPPEGAPSMMQNLVAQLGLTAGQKAKVDPVLEDDARQVKALRNSSLSAAEQQSKKREIRKTTDAKLKPLLTEAQWKKLEQLKAEREARGKKKQ